MLGKYYILLMVILLIVGVTLFYFYPNLWRSYTQENCNALIQHLNGMSKNSITLSNHLENSLSTICTYSITNRIGNRTTYNISSCDLDKIKNGLNHPETLSLSDIQTYISISDVYAVNNGISYLKKIFMDEFSHGCDQITAVSSSFYPVMFTGTEGMVYTYQTGLISVCLNQENFTESEKKECLISILNAENSTVNYYSTLPYRGDVERCVKIAGVKKEFTSQSKIEMSSVCQKLIDYRGKLLEETKRSDVDYNQKYMILAGLYLQDNYIGKEDTSKQFERDLIERVSIPKYQSLFLNKD